ncbi:hypothetical protein [Kitasatospora sp. NPDC056181]|uniref:hypothetical protein n=1 Tax=Kitasatospora sp. NPDC056181 TaxID=3345737 RepID=UPI0035E2D783
MADQSAPGRSGNGGASAASITDVSANGLFTELAANVAALQRMADLPPTRDMAVNRLKQCLPDPVRRIDLHDLIDRHVDQVIDRMHDPDRHPPDTTLGKAYLEQLDGYRAEAETLLHLLAIGVFHDRQGKHGHVWVRALQRLVDARDRVGDSLVDRAQHYPALLALHAAGCAAVLNGREDVLARLLIEVTWQDPWNGAARPVGMAVRTFDVLRDGSALPVPSGDVANRSWQSSRLRADLRDVLAEASAHSDRAFGVAFDRLEYLMLLVDLDLSGKPRVNTAPTFLAPGMLGSEHIEDHNRVSELVAQDLRPGWTMLSGGAFGGDLARANSAAAKLASLVGR